jgi:hypothetical protein
MQLILLFFLFLLSSAISSQQIYLFLVWPKLEPFEEIACYFDTDKSIRNPIFFERPHLTHTYFLIDNLSSLLKVIMDRMCYRLRGVRLRRRLFRPVVNSDAGRHRSRTLHGDNG